MLITLRTILRYYLDYSNEHSSNKNKYFNLSLTQDEIISLLNYLMRNKLAPIPLYEILKKADVEIPEELQKIVIGYKERINRYHEILRDVIELIESIGIESHVFIKFTNPIKYIQSDIDIAICNPREIKSLALGLLAKGYKLYKFRLLADSIKLMARKNNNYVFNIDIYPGIKWVGVKAVECEEVVEESINSKILRDGSLVRVPRVEDSIYIIATHAFYHRTLHLGEVLEGVELIYMNGEVRYSYLLDKAEKYGMDEAVYMFLENINLLCQELDLDRCIFDIGENYIPKLKTVKNLASYPINIPITKLLLSNLKHLLKTRYDSLFDFCRSLLTPLLHVGTRIMGEG